MSSRFQKIEYSDLTSRQKENFNFQKVSSVLSEFGYSTIRLSDDWNGADFIAQHLSGEALKVQLKSRLTFCAKYLGKDLWIAFPASRIWYLYPHDELLEKISLRTEFLTSKSWAKDGEYTWPSIPRILLGELSLYSLLESNED